MKKAILYVFSGTGNTALIADLYKKYFLEYETVIYNIHKVKNSELIPLPQDFDLVGIGYPVHGFNAPQIVNDFCNFLRILVGFSRRIFFYDFKKCSLKKCFI